MRLVWAELRLVAFDIFAFMALTAWASDGFRPWWGVFVALASAAAAFAVLTGLLAISRAVTGHLIPYLIPRRVPDAVALDADGISVIRRRPARTIRLAWTDITEITAFKADLYTVDCITLAVGMRSGETVTIDETMEGWKTAVDAFPEYIACEPWASWFVDVAFPAFAPNARRIYPIAEALSDEAHRAVAIDMAESSDDCPLDESPSDVRTYLTNGIGPLLIAVSVLLTTVGAFEHRGFGLVTVAATLAAYTVLSRIAIIAVLALRP